MDVNLILAQMPDTIAFVINAHTSHAKTPGDATRRHDRKTPYWVHPVWCASMVLHEATLSEEVRIPGAQAELLHDVGEDTTISIPEWVCPEVQELVKLMTFTSSEEESRLVWERPKVIWLLKLPDKVSNLLDGTWMSIQKRVWYRTYTHRLLEAVEREFGRDLNIAKTARAILGLTVV